VDSIWRNLRIAFPEKGPSYIFYLRIRFFLHMIRLLLDWFRLEKISCNWLRRRSDFSLPLGEIEGLAQSPPVVFFTGHVGNWEMANIYGECISMRYGVLVREQRGFLAGMLARKREKRGFDLYYVGRNEKSMVRNGRKQALGIVIDHGVRSGIRVKFFSKGCFFPRGVIWLIRKLKARAVASFVVYPNQGKRYRLIIRDVSWQEDESDQELAQRFTDELEKVVRKFPAQYLWTFKRWKFSWEVKVLVLKDGRPGHWRQSLAFVEFLRRAFSDKVVSVEEVDLSGIESNLWARTLLTLASLSPSFLGWKLVQMALRGKAKKVLCQYADVVVSAGSSLAGLNVFLRRLNQCRSVIIMDPGWGLRRADLIIVPYHDRLKGRRIVPIPGALCFFDKEKAEKDATCLSIPNARVSVFIGGPIKGYEFESANIGLLLEELQIQGGEILITTSRRTPQWVEDMVRRGNWAYSVIANEYNPKGVVEAMMERSDRILVTADSISMISEALASNKPVGVWAPILPPGKHKDFLEGLFEKKWVIPVRDIGSLRTFFMREDLVRRPKNIDLLENIKKYIEL